MFFIKKNKIIICVLLILIILLIYITNITNIPNTMILFQDEKLDVKTVWGITLEDTIPVGATLSSAQNSSQNYITKSNEEKLYEQENKQYHLNLFGIPIKSIQTNYMMKTKVKPLGNLVGIKLYTSGVLVVGVNEIKGINNQIYKPYEEANIQQGDIILSINNEKVNTAEEVISKIKNSRKDEMQITLKRNNQEITTTLKPIQTATNVYKVGLWIRDSAAGVGTASFYDVNTNQIVALGHGIHDIDTEELVEISSGEFVTATILHIEKGGNNNPGKIEGNIDKGKTIGSIQLNTPYGIYGNVLSLKELDMQTIEEVEIASRKEIKIGKANAICTLENGKREQYEIEIEKIYSNNYQNNKSMIVKVTDEKLLQKTGGIIQGMSGAPVLQNGKLIGCLTHVFVSDPQKRICSFCRHDAARVKQTINSNL